MDSGRQIYDFAPFGPVMKRAKQLGTSLFVGVSSDQLILKNKYPEFSQDERIEVTSILNCVDGLFLEENLEKMLIYSRKRAAVLVMGKKWLGKFDNLGH